MGRHLTDQEKRAEYETFAADYENGMATMDIASVYGVDNMYVHRRLRSYGHKMRRKGPAKIGPLETRPGAKVNKQELKQLSDTTSMTLEELGRHFGVSRERIRQLLDKMGITKRGGHARMIVRKQTVLDEFLFRGDGNAHAVAAEFGLAVHEVQKTLKEAGLTYMRKKRDKVKAVVYIAEYQAGATIQEIADKHGVTTNSLYAPLRKAGVLKYQKKPKRLDPKTSARLTADILKLKGTNELMKKYGVSNGLISLRRAKLGISRRQAPRDLEGFIAKYRDTRNAILENLRTREMCKRFGVSSHSVWQRIYHVKELEPDIYANWKGKGRDYKNEPRPEQRYSLVAR